APLKFTVTSMLALDKRAVVSLRLGQGVTAKPLSVSYEDAAETADANDGDPAAIDSVSLALQDDIDRLSAGLNTNGDFRAILSRRLINSLLAQITSAHNADFNIRLKQGRIRSEEVNVIVSVKNFTDIEGGEGRADLTRLEIENIGDGKATVRLSGK